MATANTLGQDRLKVFVDCSETRCDMSYFRTEIKTIDFYRDRLLSDVHILITSNRNASQGRSYQMIFFGQNKFKNRSDTLNFNSPPNATDFEQRNIVLTHLKIGILPFLFLNNDVSAFEINMKLEDRDDEQNSTEEAEDPWDYWVYRLSANGSMNFDQVYKTTRMRWNASASKVTEQKRITFYYYGDYRSTSYEFDGDNGVESVFVQNESHGLFHLYAYALSDHLAIGYEGSYRNDTFSNYKSRILFSPGIEYSIFPYEDFNNRFFTIRYSAGIFAASYIEPTIFDKLNETLPRHSLEMNLSFNQKWGNSSTRLRYSSFLNDLSLNNFDLRSEIDVRVTGGLSVNLRVEAGIVHNQINLPAGEASEEEILTRRRQIKSSFNSSISFGISYRFGSKLNNFVNPIFDD